MTTKLDEKKILRNAKKMGEEWIKAIKFDGKNDLVKIKKELEARTHSGEPVMAVVVEGIDEVVPAIIEGVTSYNKKTGYEGDIKQQIKDLKVHECIWEYYYMAFYDCAYKQCPDQSHEFGRQSFLEACRAGLGFVINLGNLMIGICRPVAHRNKDSQLHCLTGPAIVWGKHTEWWIDGVQVEEYVVMNPEKITVDEIAKANEGLQNVLIKQFKKANKDLEKVLFPYVTTHVELVNKIINAKVKKSAA